MCPFAAVTELAARRFRELARSGTPAATDVQCDLEDDRPVDDGNEVYLVVPSDPMHLRTIRLVVADAGGRAGLDASEVDDLRIAVGELSQAVMHTTDHRLVVRVVVHGARVIIRASARRESNDPLPRLSTISELIVDAVSDRYCLEHSESEMIFVVSKTAGRLSRR
jgi:hypothetical protein